MNPEPSILNEIAGWLVLFLMIGGSIAAAISEKARFVIVLLIMVAIAVKLFLFSDQEKEETVNRPLPSNTSSSPETATVTLQNYRYKGDDIKLECSGTTGNIKCKAAQ